MVDEENVFRNIERILNAESVGNYDKINQHLTKKKVDWYKQNKNSLNLKGSDVRKAYEMVLFKYMKINPEDIIITYESKTKIRWKAYNWCPVLEACKRLNRDTRKICKAGWEISNQKMIEQINPKLIFSRNYLDLRPHGQYCEEQIELTK